MEGMFGFVALLYWITSQAVFLGNSDLELQYSPNLWNSNVTMFSILIELMTVSIITYY